MSWAICRFNLLHRGLVLLALLSSFSSDVYGQIEVSYTIAKSLVGVTAPRVVGDRILIAEDSKPQISLVAVIKVESSEKVRVKARRSLFESVELVQLTEKEYLLTGEGEYLVEAISASWDRSLKVVVGKSDNPPGPSPGPVDPPKPVDPNAIPEVVGILPAQAKGFEAVFLDAASKVESKQIKSDRELLDFVKPATAKARQDANKPLDVLLETQLPDGSFLGKEAEVAAILRRVAKSWK